MDKLTIMRRQGELINGAKNLRDEIMQLKETLQQRESDLFATNGAIEDCQFWLNHLEAEEHEMTLKATIKESQEAYFAALDKREVIEPKNGETIQIRETSPQTLTDFVKMAQGNGVDETDDLGY